MWFAVAKAPVLAVLRAVMRVESAHGRGLPDQTLAHALLR